MKLQMAFDEFYAFEFIWCIPHIHMIKYLFCINILFIWCITKMRQIFEVSLNSKNKLKTIKLNAIQRIIASVFALSLIYY